MTLLEDRKRWSTMRRIPVRTVAEVKWRAHVGRSTRAAVLLGLLPDPVNCICVDCGRNAECYDHRDYSKPLDVDPVCLGCNSRRGRGDMPQPKVPSDFRLNERGEMVAASRASFYRERDKAA